MAFITDLQTWGISTAVSAAQSNVNQLLALTAAGVTDVTNVVVQDLPQGFGNLGTPVYSTLVFHLNPDETILLSTGAAIGLVVYEDVVMAVNQKKHMSTTRVAGRNDTVKEYISNGEYDINITIRLNSNWARVMPARQIREMFGILQASRSIRVSSRFLNFFNITNLVIESWSMPQESGVVNTQIVKLKCVSDTDNSLFSTKAIQNRISRV